MGDAPSELYSLFSTLPRASIFNSASGMPNCENPQAKQTNSLGNTKMLGLSRFLKPRKWTFRELENFTN